MCIRLQPLSSHREGEAGAVNLSRLWPLAFDLVVFSRENFLIEFSCLEHPIWPPYLGHWTRARLWRGRRGSRFLGTDDNFERHLASLVIEQMEFHRSCVLSCNQIATLMIHRLARADLWTFIYFSVELFRLPLIDPLPSSSSSRLGPWRSRRGTG